MNDLTILKRTGGDPVRIIERIGKRHTELGTILLKDEFGTLMETIKEDTGGNTEKTNREMLRQWLAGNGTPVTWKVLVDALVEIKEKALADDIVDALNT